MRLVGYSDRLSVEPGGAITFMVSSEPGRFSASLVRLIHGDTNPSGPGYKDRPVESSLEGEYDGKLQRLRPGSYVRVAHDAALAPAGDFTLQMWICPTLPGKAVQTIVSKRGADGGGFALRLENGRLTLRLGEAALSVDRTVRAGQWYFVAAVYDAAAGTARLVLEPSSGVTLGLDGSASGRVGASAASLDGDVLIAAEAGLSGEVDHFYNGKIDAPKLFARALSERELQAIRDDDVDAPLDAVASWDFSEGISTWTVVDRSPNGHDGVTVNKPTRGVTGRSWTGRELSWKHAPREYGAIHFHEDDLSDAGWEPSFSWTVPADLKSGIYAVHLVAGEEEDYVPFFVVPRLGRPSAKVAFLVPTFSYLAYANEQQLGPMSPFASSRPDYPSQPQDKYIVETPLLSVYDHHTDGSGVCYSSWMRPIVNMRPKYNMHHLGGPNGHPHQLNADLHLIDWLEEQGIEYDVITDLELHHEGAARLKEYRAVATGTHAEYCSESMLNGAEEYLNGGGRLIHLSGNAMFWVTELDAETGTGVEIRRNGMGLGMWKTTPSEGYLSSTGEPGGVWHVRGRSAHSWLGIGSVGMGSAGRPYDRQPASFDPKAAFIFEGIEDDEQIGAIPCLVYDWGAAGFEIDGVDSALGTPEHTMILATATGFDTDSWVVLDEGLQLPGVWDRMRADMVLVEYPNGGAVFGVGSIAWCGCLSHNSYDNTVSRVTKNVFDGFAAERLPIASEAGRARRGELEGDEQEQRSE